MAEVAGRPREINGPQAAESWQAAGAAAGAAAADSAVPGSGEAEEGGDEARDDAAEQSEEEGTPTRQGEHPARQAKIEDEARTAAEEFLRAAQMRIECVKVCAPGQLTALVEGSHAMVAGLRNAKTAQHLKNKLAQATSEHQSLLTQWSQRSGTIRVVVRVRPAVQASEEGEAVKTITGPGSRCRGLVISVQRGRRKAEEHSFKRFDYVLDAGKDQKSVFQELQAMLPSSGQGALTGPPQSACVLAYGQTGSGKTHTMHGGTGEARGLVPRVLLDVFSLAGRSGASISLSAVEIYNDIAYDLLDSSRTESANAVEAGAGRGFAAGHKAPPQGLNFRHGCASALGQAVNVPVATVDEAHAMLAQAAERRSTRSTSFNASSSRSHSMVFVYAHLPGASASEPALRLAFVDLAGSERLPACEAKDAVAEESRHINMSLSSLGSVIHALRHKANHLPFRGCLLTRMLEPFFQASGRVLLCVNISPEHRYAQETLCSLTFADRASRAVLGADSALEVQRGQALTCVRDAHLVVRSLIRQLLPRTGLGSRMQQRIPDGLALILISYMPEHGAAAFACRSWSQMCQSHRWWGRELQHSRKLALKILSFISPAMDAAGVCRCWWSAAGAYRVTMEASSAKVVEAHAGTSHAMWATAGARQRAAVWKALLSAGGGSGAVGDMPLALVRECVIGSTMQKDALRQLLLRMPQLRVAEVPSPDLVCPACTALARCSQLRALSISLDLVPNLINMKDVLLKCRQLRVLVLSCVVEHPFSLELFVDELPKVCGLRELSVSRCIAGWKDIERLVKSCTRLQTLRLSRSCVTGGHDPLKPPPLVPLARLRHLRSLDVRAQSGTKHSQRPWLTDDMFGVTSRLAELRELRADGQKLLSERCFFFLRRHTARLRVLHLSGCKAMSGDAAFALVHLCETLESLRLPALAIGQSERNLGTDTLRWCQGLSCPQLRELCVDAWPSLEDAGVQLLAKQNPTLRVLWLRQAPRLSDDAVTYLMALQDLRSLCLAACAGITDRALQELAGAPRLCYLDLSGCRQLTEPGIVELAKTIATPDGPPLRSVQFDLCKQLGRAAAEALAAAPGLHRCSLTSCRPLPEGATAWHDIQSHAAACEVLGVQQSFAALEDGEGGHGPLDAERRPPAAETAEEAPQCAICMDDITIDDAVWECPVCCNKLHNTEDCARGWLRHKQSCPTCRAAAVPPSDEPERSRDVVNPFRSWDGMPQQGSSQRHRPARSYSADVPSSRVGARNGYSAASARARGASPSLGPDLSLAGMNLRAPQALDRPPAEEQRQPAEEQASAVQRRRPPRPVGPAANRLAAAVAATPGLLGSVSSPHDGAARSVTSPPGSGGSAGCPRPVRSASLPGRRGPGARSGQGFDGFALAGLSIVGASRSAVA